MHKIYAKKVLVKIGSLQLPNQVILAPMAGISNLPYRRIMKRHGAGLVFTEMVSANGLIRSGRKTFELLDSAAEEEPLGVQLFGEDPATLAAAARLVEGHGALIDINMGCPVNKVIRSGAGSALLRDPALIGRIVAAVRRATALPLTVKIRSGWDRSAVNFLETARVAVDEGVDAVTLHPRTRSQGFSGQADWDQIADLKAMLSVPVIGSGDIFTAEDGLKMLGTTGCDAIMIGRGGYGNPWLISDLVGQLEGRPPAPAPTPQQRCEAALLHMQYYVATFGPRKTLLDMRKHLCWYSRGLPGAAQFRTRINATESLEQAKEAVEAFFLPGDAP